MGMDKSLLIYHDKPQREYVYEMLENYCHPVKLSLRMEQILDDRPMYHAVLDNDEFAEHGPISGLFSNFSQGNNQAVLVCTCDTPFLNDSSLEELICAREKGSYATVYKNGEFIEPFPGIYEPEIIPILFEAFELGNYSITKILSGLKIKTIVPLNPELLRNVNTPEEYEDALRILGK